MKFGVAIRNMGPQSDRTTLRQCARIAENADLDALFVSDHLALQPEQAEGSGGRYLDVLTTLAFLAGVTDRIRLGTSVLVLPYRPAVLTAKQVATIQEVSGERLILGVGVGWMAAEFAALGVDSKRRGALTDDTLAVLDHLFSAEQSARPFSGKLVSFDPFIFLPRPARPSLWIGGNTQRTIERVVTWGDGWHPMLPPNELAPAVAALQSAMAAAGRGSAEVVVRRTLDLSDLSRARERLARDREAGATYYILDLGRYSDSQAFAAGVERFMGHVATP